MLTHLNVLTVELFILSKRKLGGLGAVGLVLTDV